MQYEQKNQIKKSQQVRKGQIYFILQKNDIKNLKSDNYIYTSSQRMEFDILNELLTSTVSDLFKTTETTTAESRQRVKQLQGLIKNQSSKRGSSVDSFQSLLSGNQSMMSQGSNKGPANRKTPLRPCRSVEEWIKVEAPRRLKQSIQKLGITQQLLKKKQDLDAFVGAMNIDKLAGEKKKVKNELRCYDNDFLELFRTQPNHDEKEPFRPLYFYYKKLKEHMNLKDENHLSPQQIQKKIKQIKAERKELRTRIQSYQRQFQTTNNRRIKYERDIAPIKVEYNKYKDLKHQLLRLQQMLSK